ncbi:MAG: hypothetical protein JST26_04110 [Bacteroidetes bacterium]|nr:hypothetical protein [Bacteroidota bacterium]
MLKHFLALFVFILPFAGWSQEDLLGMVSDSAKKAPSRKVYATFKTTRVVSAQTIETVRKRNLDFRITHRFGNLYNNTLPNALNDAAHKFFGMDNISDVRLSFDYGITDDITVGIGRSKYREMYDGTFKWRFLTQRENNSVPVSVCFYGNVGYTSMTTDNLYAGVIRPKTNEAHRFQYLSQFIIARKFSKRLSLELLPTYVHRNFIKQQVNTRNGKEDQNDLFSLGIGGRIKLSPRFALVADYFYNFSDFQRNNPAGFYNPLSVGVEIETGGHVFHVNFCNSTAILESSMLTSTQDTWKSGQIKLGFNISRWFVL